MAIMLLTASTIALLGANIVWIIRNNDLRIEIKEVKDNSDYNYEAASLLSDFIRHTIDYWQGETVYNAGQELEESFYEYFQDLEIGAYKTQHVRSVKDFNNFSWCY